MQQPQVVSPGSKLLYSVAKVLAAVVLFTVAAWAGATRPSYAYTGRPTAPPPPTADTTSGSYRSSSRSADAAAPADSPGASASAAAIARRHEASTDRVYGYRYTGFDFADRAAAVEGEDDPGRQPSTSGAQHTAWGAPRSSSIRGSASYGSHQAAAREDQLHQQDHALTEDDYTSEHAEDVASAPGVRANLRTSWQLVASLPEMEYSQFWKLVRLGHVEQVQFYGQDMKSMMVMTRPTAPGGVRSATVEVPPDTGLLDHLLAHGVVIDTGTPERARVEHAFFAQVLRYTFPVWCMSALFWVLHTCYLDPQPNLFKRQTFAKLKRELMTTSSKLNFRTPAKQVAIDRTAPDFIPWKDINGIEEVKNEVTEIINYLKNPELLKQKGVNRIGGILLAGAPGTGKTLLAKAVAAESEVAFFSCNGTDFFDTYSGVGARRVRETFELLRNCSPAILFVDEFDALGAARGSGAGEESANIINELLVQMDGFEDNRGIVVMGATNRPAAIDPALVRPGRFDRIIHMPLPDCTGRAGILQVHARTRNVDSSINWQEVSRATTGFTGADCMGLIMRAERMAALQGREMVTEEDIYAAMEHKMLEAYYENTHSPKAGFDGNVPNPLSQELKQAIAVYEAGKALTAYITPEYEDIARVSVCPGGMIMGYTMLVGDEERTADAILTRGEMESVMVVHLAGRCAEKLILGEAELTGLGAPDLFHANHVAREMILECGMGKRMGPMDLMQIKRQFRSSHFRRMEDPVSHTTDMSTEQARVAMEEIRELLEAAEAKAYYGIATNWGPLRALAQELLERGTMTGKDVERVLEQNGVVHFQQPYVKGYGWDAKGSLMYPFKPARPPSDEAKDAAPVPAPVLTGIAAKTWDAGTERDVPRGPDGKFVMDFHYNSPYTVRADLSEEFFKDKERYGY